MHLGQQSFRALRVTIVMPTKAPRFPLGPRQIAKRRLPSASLSFGSGRPPSCDSPPLRRAGPPPDDAVAGVFLLFGASVGGDLETRVNFDHRGRGPSHGIRRWIVLGQKKVRGIREGGTRWT